MGHLQIFLSGGLAILVYVTLVWLFSLAKKDAGIMDVFWGPGFILAAYIYLLVNPVESLQVSLLFFAVILWGARLALHIGLRNAGEPEDARYANWRQQFGTRWWWYSYLRVFILQGAVMWIVSLPLLTGLQDQSPLNIVDYVGWFLFLAGFLFETIGDWQLRQFKKDPNNRGKVMNTGLWGMTRHPNYFGEAVLWWGLTLVAIEVSTFYILISPVIMTWLLVKVSGVKMLDEQLIKTKPDYAEYIKTTNAFIPRGSRMKTKLILTIVLAMGISTMLSVNAADKPQKLVDYVDIQRFMGDWYVISSIPTMFEKDAYNAIETYTWNEKKGIVDVGFTYRKSSPDGKVKNMTQRGFIYDTKSNAEWRVQPLWPLKLGYLIIDLAEDYNYTVVGVPSRNYLWIMARETTLSDSVYQGILDRVAKQGYDLNAIQMVPQVWD